MYVITGATGNTGKPAAEALLAKGEKVRVIGRDPKKLEPFVQKGAEAFVGNVEDEAAMTQAFTGAKAVYLVVPAAFEREDFRAYQGRISDAYAGAAAKAGVRYAVLLSSIGASHAEKTGPIVGLHNLEEKMKRIAGLNVLCLRPVNFMENLLMNIDPIRTMGMVPGPYSGDAPFPMIATRDIGAAAAERLARCDFSGHEVRELHGQRDVTMKEAASVIGKAIGKPGLSYMQLPHMVLGPALEKMGMLKSSVALLLEMWDGVDDGLVVPLEKRSERNTTPTTLETFVAEEFVPRFQAKAARA